jgi:hypothetical protein
MSKANTLWIIAIGLLAVVAALELRLHRSPGGVVSTPAAKSTKVPAASNEFVRPPEAKSLVGETVEPSGPAAETQITAVEQPTFDRDFVGAAAKPYVEAYQRQHPVLKARTFAWDQFQVVFVSAPDSSIEKGYLGVFFPTSEGSGAGFTCFQVEQDADHLVPVIWGYAGNVTHAIEDFRRGAAERRGCNFSLL